MKFRIFSDIKLFLNSGSRAFLFEIFRKRKKYIFLNIFSGLADAFFELITLSMLYFILQILTLESKNAIHWENVFFINRYSFLIEYLNSFPFRTIFIISILIITKPTYIKMCSIPAIGLLVIFDCPRATRIIFPHLFDF